MSSSPILVRDIKQKDNHTFSITWSDGIEQSFKLSMLQRVCPCAGCRELKEQTQSSRPTIKEDVRATFVRSVGRYALQIQFTSGCSNGIYSFDMLRQLKGMHHE